MKKKLIFGTILTAMISFLASCATNTTNTKTSLNQNTSTTTKTNHQHTYSSEWKYDDESHYHPSTCGCELKSELSAHTYGEYKIITEATTTTEGLMERECSVCGRKEETVIPVHKHTFSYEYEYDETYHWHNSTCSDIDEISGKTEHVFDIWQENGKKMTKSCKYCDYSISINDNSYTYIDNTKTSLYFGFYPQTKVNDKTIIENLNLKAGTLPTSKNLAKWNDYGYYQDGNVKSYMYYIDIDLNKDGQNDYRGVYFTEYRPYSCSSSSEAFTSYQDDNGYEIGNVYWFSYEPIKWNILKTKMNNNALIISDLLLDANSYSTKKVDRTDLSDYQSNRTNATVYGNNYQYSFVRTFINKTFYNTAFSTTVKKLIKDTEVDNSISSTLDLINTYTSINTTDKLFLLSTSEVNTYYNDETSRCAKGSDYAKAQGLYQAIDNTSSWLTRTPYNFAKEYCDFVKYNGSLTSVLVDDSIRGYRPACWISL